MNYRLPWCIVLILCTFLTIQAQTQVDTLAYPALGGEIVIAVNSVTTNDWKVEVVDAPNWISVTKKDTTGVIVRIQPNESGIDRLALIRLYSDTDKDREVINPFLQLGNKRIEGIVRYNYQEQYQWLNVSANWGNKWTASVNPKASSWAFATRHGDDGIMLYLTENTGRTIRQLEMSVQGEGKELTVLQVNQFANPLPLLQRDFSVDGEASLITLDAGLTDSLKFQLPEWITLHSKHKQDEGMRYELEIKANLEDVARYDSIRVETESGAGQALLPVSQYGRSPYMSLEAKTLEDIQIKVASGEASSYQKWEEIEHSFDGDPATIYHSSWDNSAADYLPITLTYQLQKPETVDYLVYYPRTDGGINGIFENIDILIQTEGKKDFKFLMNVDFKGQRDIKRIDFPKTQKKVVAVRLVVKSGTGENNGFASCAEMQFYQKVDIGFRYTDLFADSICSALKPGISERKINRCKQPFFRNLALHMLHGNYPDEFRVQSYKAWMSPDVQAKQNGVMPFSLLDNPTGIAAVAGEPLVVLVDRDVKEGLSICIQNLSVKSGSDGFGGKKYMLHKGLNVVKPVFSGLIYVMYHSETPEVLPPVSIHFATGRVNGYFDITKHIRPDGTSRWNELLARAGDKYFDVLSPYVHFTFRAEDFRRYVPDVNHFLAVYDTLVCHEQEFEGLRKYNRWMKNRLYIHTTYKEMLYATHYHLGFQETQLPYLITPDSLMGAYCWGPAHELGHALQVVPPMNWTAMMEVTNNIQSMEMQRLWGNPSRLHTESREANGYGNIYEQAMNVAFVHKRPFTYLSDWFDQLVPFWQLRLYMMDVCGKTDFYKDVYEASRRLNEQDNHLTSGQLQLEFVYNSCVASGIDLRPFFDKWGWLQPTERLYDDYYGKDSILVASEDLQKLNARIDSLRLPAPAHAAEYITDQTLNLYTHPQPLHSGTAHISSETGEVNIKDASGTVAFELYQGEKMIGVSYRTAFALDALRGLDVSNIIVKAVFPDGRREVCKK